MVELPNGEKRLRICFAVSTQYHHVTDGKTDILPRHNLCLCRVSHSKSVTKGVAVHLVQWLLLSLIVLFVNKYNTFTEQNTFVLLLLLLWNNDNWQHPAMYSDYTIMRVGRYSMQPGWGCCALRCMWPWSIWFALTEMLQLLGDCTGVWGFATEPALCINATQPILGWL